MRLFLSKNSRELMNAGQVSTAHRVPNLANTRVKRSCGFLSYDGGRGGTIIHKALMDTYPLIFLFSITTNLAERVSAEQGFQYKRLFFDLVNRLGRDLCKHYVQKGH